MTKPELAEEYDRLARAGQRIVEAKAATCCHAKSHKQWIADPQGVPWETFLTYGESTIYGRRLAREAAHRESFRVRSAKLPNPEFS